MEAEKRDPGNEVAQFAVSTVTGLLKPLLMFFRAPNSNCRFRYSKINSRGLFKVYRNCGKTVLCIHALGKACMQASVHTVRATEI